MVHDVLITLSGYPAYSSEYKKCLKPSSGQHHPITPRLFASTLCHYKIFPSRFSARTRWNLPLASFQCFREISSTGSRLRRVSCKSLGKGVTNSYRVTKDWFSIFFWPKVAILEGCVWIYSSRPCYIDHSLIDKDALGETRTVWWTKSCAKWMLKHLKKNPWHIKCLPYEQRKKGKVNAYIGMYFKFGLLYFSKAMFFEFFLARHITKPCGMEGMCCRNFKGASKASTLQPRNVD